MTGFSGVLKPDTAEELPAGVSIYNKTFIDPAKPSVLIFRVDQPGFVWDGRNWSNPYVKSALASDVGQVFGIAIDDQQPPNFYVAATSAYGLDIVIPDTDGDGRPERVKTGGVDARWMRAQFGKGTRAGPGSIWKIDSQNVDISLFATVSLDGVADSGPGLGSLAYDATHKQIYVSAAGFLHRKNTPLALPKAIAVPMAALISVTAIFWKERSISRRAKRPCGAFEVEHVETWIAQQATSRDTGDERAFAVTHDGKYVGSVELIREADRRWYPGILDRASLGGQGFATCAARLMCLRAATKPRVGRLHARHIEGNAASARVLAKLGFARMAIESWPADAVRPARKLLVLVRLA